MSFYDVIINNDNNNDNDNIFEKEIFTINSLDNIINIDLRNKMPPIDNYELLGSTANSIAILIEYDIPNYKCSRIFLYYNERLNTDNYNIKSSIKSLLEYGFCSSENYPYNSELINDEPLEEIYKNAKEKLNKFSIIKIKKDLNSLLLALVNNEPFITTVAIFESFELSNKKIKIPKSNEKQLGGITIVVCGFDISKQIFIIQLMNNYYELPFLYLFKENYSSNCYIFILRNFINFIPITYNKIEELEKIEELKSIDYLDLRSKFTEVYDQGKIGSCTANALCSIFEYDNLNFKGSRLFLYYNERSYINEINNDGGIVKNFFTAIEEKQLRDLVEVNRKLKPGSSKYAPMILETMSRMQIQFDIPESILNKLLAFVKSFVSEEDQDLVLSHYQYLDYYGKYGNGNSPKLPPHLDVENYYTKISVDYQMSSNIDWAIVVEDKKYYLNTVKNLENHQTKLVLKSKDLGVKRVLRLIQVKYLFGLVFQLMCKIKLVLLNLKIMKKFVTI